MLRKSGWDTNDCTDVTQLFFNTYAGPTVEVSPQSPVWRFGRVFRNTSGYHGEYVQYDTSFLCIRFLGQREEEALNRIIEVFNSFLDLSELCMTFHRSLMETIIIRSQRKCKRLIWTLIRDMNHDKENYHISRFQSVLNLFYEVIELSRRISDLIIYQREGILSPTDLLGLTHELADMQRFYVHLCFR